MAHQAAEQPKDEVGATQFIRSNPTYDGRGIIVGIFDTGVDPGAPGLQTTSDGKPKMIDLVDCTGAGDVDTSKEVEAVGGELTGLSGRKLQIPPEWPAIGEGSKYRLGLKPAFELYPKPLISRIKAERKKRHDEAQRDAIEAARRAATDGPKPTAEGAEGKKGAELAARVTLLGACDKAYEDSGPIYDVVTYKDAAGTWRVCVDTSERGALADAPLLAPFRLERKYGTLDASDAAAGAESLLNFSVDVFANGARTAICVDSGSHGTHVAGIVGAHFAESPELNGIAPGCQMIGFKIGDTRLSAMETGTALVRALGAAIERGVHIVNLSFGEYGHVDNLGRFTAMANLAVHKHGLIFVTSNGNNGPALSTGGCPAVSSCCISVGAFASAAMMGPQYSLRAKLPDIQYTWSSRGPTYDGAIIPSVSAPGGAIAPVPNWTLQGRQLMNGTSMAAPNACGGITLLLSALAAQGRSWSEAQVRKAIESTALRTPNATGSAVETWALGRGLLQVGDAHAWLQTHAAYEHADVRFEATCTVGGCSTAAGGPNARGVYLREPQHACAADVGVDVVVRPRLHESAPNKQRVALDVGVSLRASASWLSCAPFLALTHGGKGFNLKVSPQQLPPGAHYAEVCGYDASQPDSLGPLFVLPVTVCRPHADLTAPGAPCHAEFERVPFSPGTIERRFVVPPRGATWATITLRAKGAPRSRELAGSVVYMLAAAQLRPHQHIGRSSTTTRVTMGVPDADAPGGVGAHGPGAPATEYVTSLACVGGVTMELAVAQWWMSLGETELDIRVEYFGVTPSVARLHLDGRELYTELELHTFRRTHVEPAGSLNTLRRSVRPHKAQLLPPAAPCDGAPGVGDAGVGGKLPIYDYVLAYKFSLKEASDAVTIRFPSLSSQLYEGAYEAQLHALFDANKQLLRWGDFYVDPTKLKAGDYEVRLQLRHDAPSYLEKLKDLPMIVDVQIAPVNVDFHWSRASVLADPSAGAKPPARTILEPHTRMACFAASPAAPSSAEPGDTLVGTVTYAKLSADALGPAKRPGGWHLSMLVPPAPKKDEGPAKDDGAKEDETAPHRLAAAVRTLRISQLSKLSPKCKPPKKAAAATTAAAAADGAKKPEEAASAAAAAKPDPAEAAAAAAERYAALLAELRSECAGVVVPADAPPELPPLLPLLQANLAHVEGLAAGRRDEAAPLEAVVEAAGEVLALIDTAALAAALGVPFVDADDKRAKQKRDVDEQQKKALVSALHLKAVALADLHKAAAKASDAPATDAAVAAALERLDAGVAALHAWAPKDEHWQLLVAWHRAHGRPATALQALDDHLGKEKGLAPKDKLELRLELLGELGWDHWVANGKRLMLTKFPAAYPPPYNV